MPRLDLYHSAVKAALVKDGWRITDDPLQLQYEGFNLYADLGAERPVFAERRTEKIAVEIKGFGNPSPISELEKAVGQYALYRFMLQRIQPERLLYLAIQERYLPRLFWAIANSRFCSRTAGFTIHL